MIRNVVVHLLNEQPLLADLYELPKNDDQGVLCTNLRMMDGRRPVFIDRIESIFFFPYLHIRFLEIPPASGGVVEVQELAEQAAPPPPAEPDEDLEIDEDFLKRIRDV